MRVFTHYSSIALFVGLSASLAGPKHGEKRALRFIPKHPSTSGTGAEADDSPSLRIDKQPHKRKYFKFKQDCLSAYEQVFSARDKTSEFYTKITSIEHSSATRRAPFRTSL